MDRIGFIGLGNMGRPMAVEPLSQRLRAVVFDVDAHRVSALESLGARPAAHGSDVAGASDVVFTMLPNSAVVEQVLAGDDGVLRASAHPARVVVDMSTIDPLVTDRLAGRGVGTRHRFCRCARRPAGEPRRAR